MANKPAPFFRRLSWAVGALGSLALLTPIAHAAEDGLPPEGPRDFSAFAKLLAHSPFVMPSSGGDQSPLAQRYNLTGAAKIDNKPHVFILDVQNQTRLMLSPDQTEGGVELISFEDNPDSSKVRAVIRVGTETGSLAFAQAQLAPPPVATTAAEGVANPEPGIIANANAPTAQTNSVPPNASQPMPSAADLQAAGLPPGTQLQPVPPRRILRRTTNVPLPTNAP